MSPKPTYYVERDCCLGFGRCSECSSTGRSRTIQIGQLSMKKAKEVAKNWDKYNPLIKMEVAK